MQTYQVDYSNLVAALQHADHEGVNRIISHMLPRLQQYLAVVYNASPHEAEEAVQRAFANVLEKVRSDAIENSRAIYSYILRACKNEYIGLKKGQQKFDQNETNERTWRASPAQQIEHLLDEDRQRILNQCLQALGANARAYIAYIMKNPEVSTKSLSKRFDISESNVRVKKHRILEALRKCVQKKWDRE